MQTVPALTSYYNFRISSTTDATYWWKMVSGETISTCLPFPK